MDYGKWYMFYTALKNWKHTMQDINMILLCLEMLVWLYCLSIVINLKGLYI